MHTCRVSGNNMDCAIFKGSLQREDAACAGFVESSLKAVWISSSDGAATGQCVQRSVGIVNTYTAMRAVRNRSTFIRKMSNF